MAQKRDKLRPDLHGSTKNQKMAHGEAGRIELA
jgi:hypothetical protein